MVFIEGLYGLLLVVHVLVCFTLVGSITHNLIYALGYVRGKFQRQSSEQRSLKIAAISYALVYFIGMIIYPAFRVYIRGEYFDTDLRWATGIFEIKEHWASIGLVLFAACWFLRKSFVPEQEKAKLWLYVPMCVIINIVIWYNIVSGLVLTLQKGSWL
jgi:hypothetical protein